jgi:GH24 family phage-related lysozyme (muramidase)
MPSILTRWKARRAVRAGLLSRARRAFAARKTKANLALVKLRKRQVAQADRVVARHTPRPAGVSQAGVDLIASFEGCILHPYQDSVGVWTIGYGHTEGVHSGTRPLVSKRAAMNLLRSDLDKKYAPPVFRLGLPLNQNQIDALVSVSYNLGPGILEPSHTLGAALRDHRWHDAADAILLYDKAGGQRLAGLTRRRQAERALFLKPTKGA